MILKIAMYVGYDSDKFQLQSSQILTIGLTSDLSIIILKFLVAGVLVILAVYIVMSATRKTPSPVAPDTALPKRSKKVRSVSVSVDLECPDRISLDKNMAHPYFLRSIREPRFRAISECVGTKSPLYSQNVLNRSKGLRFQLLTWDCKLKIFSYLTHIDRGRAAQVCQEWRCLASVGNLWDTVDFTEFPLCYINHKDCTKVCYALYRDKMRKFMEFLCGVRPLLKRLRLAFDIGDHEDGWYESIESFIDSAYLQQLEYLQFNWKETPGKPYWETANVTWSTGDARDLMYKHRYRQRQFIKLFEKITANAPNITHLVIPFEWSNRSLLSLGRLIRLDSLVLEKYFVFQSLNQESLNQLFQSVPRLRHLILEVWTPSGKGLQLYSIKSHSLKSLDISQCRGFYLEQVILPEVEVFKVSRHPWNGPLATGEASNMPCLYTLLSQGCPSLKQLNEHVLRPEWRDVVYSELQLVFSSVCSCRDHKSGWPM